MFIDSYLKSVNNDNKEFYLKLQVILTNLTKKLNIIPLYFRHFSRHDASHSEKILQYIEMLLGKEGISILSQSDWAMIILASYSHDVGMSIQHNQIVDFL